MLTATTLNTYKQKDLAQMAKQRGITGWHAMRKEQLVKALAKVGKVPKVVRRLAKPKGSAAVRQKAVGRRGKASRSKSPATMRKIQAVHLHRERMRHLATNSLTVGADGKRQAPEKDRIVLMVRDPYWLHAHWELTDRNIERAQAALAERWHSSRPVLRLVKVVRGSLESTSDQIVRVIDIHGAVCNWYIDVQDPPATFRVDIGYLTSDGHFQTLSRSNVVTTPSAGGSEMIDGNWADVIANSERIYAMSGGFDDTPTNGELQELFEERLRRPMGSPMVTRFGCGAEAVLNKSRSMNFSVDAEMIVYGMADPDAFVTMGGEPVKLGPDGSFTARVSLPDKRQIIPIVAGRSDGVEEQTIVLAVERNTKVMEPIIREPGK